MHICVSIIGIGDDPNRYLKLTLALVWRLIFHNQICTGFGLEGKNRGTVSIKQLLIDFLKVQTSIVLL